MYKPFKLRHLAAPLLLACAGISVQAQAADFVFSGLFVNNTDRVEIDFQLAAAATVQLWTDSFQDGLNFDPTLALFDGNRALLQIIDDHDGSGIAGLGAYDSAATLSAFGAGHYHLTLSTSGNDALGPWFANGFSLDGQAPVALIDWTQPSSDINKNDQKGGFWQLHLHGVDQAAMVPEPTGLALMLAGLLGLGVARRFGGRHDSKAS